MRRFYEEVWNRGNLVAASELAAADCLRHDPPGPVPVVPAGFAAMAPRSRAALPDLRLRIDLMLADVHLVAARYRGAHSSNESM